MEPLGRSRNNSLTRPKHGRQLSFLVCCGWLLSVASFSAMSVEEAYRAIPHRYTPFESKSVKMSPKDTAVLQEFFRLLNLAIVDRVQAQTWFQSNGKRGVAFPKYQRSTDGLIMQLEALTLPNSLKAVHRDVIDALRDQRAYFEEWQRAAIEANRSDTRPVPALTILEFSVPARNFSKRTDGSCSFTPRKRSELNRHSLIICARWISSDGSHLQGLRCCNAEVTSSRRWLRP